MKNVRTRSMLMAAIASTVLAGCTTPGEENRADVYTSDQVNTRQAANVVNILAVLPARIQVDNTENQRDAQIAGGMLGAVGGGLLGGGLARHNVLATGALGAAGGGALGVAGGSLVPGKVLVEGVSIAYEQDGQTFNSAQVGRACEYQPGHALMVQTSPTTTRIQPNTTCPVPPQKT